MWEKRSKREEALCGLRTRKGRLRRDREVVVVVDAVAADHDRTKPTGIVVIATADGGVLAAGGVFAATANAGEKTAGGIRKSATDAARNAAGIVLKSAADAGVGAAGLV